MGTIIVLVVLLAMIGLAIGSMVKDKKQGKFHCGCDCAHCGRKCH